MSTSDGQSAATSTMMNESLPPETSYVKTVKSLQLSTRKDKLRKAASAKGLGGSFRRSKEGLPLRDVASERLSSERMPLNTSNLSVSFAKDSAISSLAPTEELLDEIPTPMQAIIHIVFGKGIVSYLLLAAPVALLAVYLKWSPTWIFSLNFLAIIPLAAILGDFTEEVALHTNETIGGLVNASFGNAVEVVVAIQALLANEIRVVQASMLGSILSNLLLVLGTCFFVGGLYYKEQRFNASSATANMGLLALSSIALVLPTPFAEYYELHDEKALTVSRAAAVFLMCMYIQLLIFQLVTHTHLFAGVEEEGAELASMSFPMSILGLCTTTLVVAVFSNFLVASIDGFTQESGVSRTFVGLILLPIIGNTVEHVSAVVMAAKNKMDLAMGVAIGSCTQISLFVVPLTVLVGWMVNRDMNLNFPHFEIILYILSVLTVSIVLSYPKCNWLEGSLLITTYLLIATGFWFEKVKTF